ncbi:FAD-dependent oxidoreductase [Zavarzinia compransoris]|uniref:FAD-dependent oxidoreductase n=1 Tax=Zavarzinia marina TaxID=2911065 RepID=UPI001F1D4406|nr:FAD-dependent oxidoreductase [Zavarzinia marina]MCF4164125.1 FAD-dependent oxidoreductase [Zavarzinia marina]
MTNFAELPVAVIGAGPVGLAAASHLVERGLTPLVFEAGPAVGHAVRDWGHVRLFSPWRFNVDGAARRLLAAAGWHAPDADGVPTGRDVVERYLAPLAALPGMAPHLRLGARVVAVTRLGRDKARDDGRDAAPFAVVWRDAAGIERRSLARAVIDASGTWTRPNPMGVDGLAVPGEAAAADRIAHGLPDVLGRDRDRHAGRHVLVVGGGHSAINVVLDLLRLREEVATTRVTWALRRPGIERLLGGGLNDQLPERGNLGTAALRAIETGAVTLLAPFAAEAIARDGDGLTVEARQGETPIRLAVDRIVVATGFRPDLSLARELRVALDPVVEAPPALAPLIDPNLHSCGTVPPHGARELAHPEAGFYVAGAKSYGRAPTFLMATGHEQVRSIVAEIAGDHAAASRVELVLPETGVCNGGPAAPVRDAPKATSCCGTAA